jgi:electron transport complex protein RnfG
MRLEFRMILVLMGVALGSAALLGLVFSVTTPVIAAQKEQARQDALDLLLPEAERFEPDTVIVDGDSSVVYHAYDENDRKVGIVFTVAPKGYAGPVETMVGLRADSTVSAIRIASAAEGMAETPGLGARVLEDAFRDQFKGLKHDELYLTKEGGKVEAITAATISSNAVTSGVRNGVERYLPYLCDSETPKPEEGSEAVEEASEGVSKGIKKELKAKGYIEEFKVIVWFDPEGRIEKVEIPRAGFNETEGFGSRCREAEFLSRFKKLTDPEDVKRVDAISGATETSEAVKDAVVRALTE